MKIQLLSVIMVGFAVVGLADDPHMEAYKKIDALERKEISMSQEER